MNRSRQFLIYLYKESKIAGCDFKLDSQICNALVATVVRSTKKRSVYRKSDYSKIIIYKDLNIMNHEPGICNQFKLKFQTVTYFNIFKHFPQRSFLVNALYC